MIKGFLQDELSEAHLGLCSSARTHLERFKSLLYGFYTAKFGDYPPPSIDHQTTVFEMAVFRTLRADFEALYEYLVDRELDTSHTEGNCTLQSVQSFDARHKFQTLAHPLPLLPDTPTSGRATVTWLRKPRKAGRARQIAIHTGLALRKATNKPGPNAFDNDLLKVYRAFEESPATSATTKADKQEDLGPVEGRKARWILIYSMYQVLRRATEPPPEASGDIESVPYHLCTSTTNLPPWEHELPLEPIVPQSQPNDEGTYSSSTSTVDWSLMAPKREAPRASSRTRLALSYLSPSRPSSSSATAPIVGRDFSQRGSPGRRNSVIQRTWGLLTRLQKPEKGTPRLAAAAMAPTARRTSLSHESLIYGYGGGTRLREEQPARPSSATMTSSSSGPSGAGSSSSRLSYDNNGSGDDFRAATPDSSAHDSPRSARIDVPEEILPPNSGMCRYPSKGGAESGARAIRRQTTLPSGARLTRSNWAGNYENTSKGPVRRARSVSIEHRRQSPGDSAWPLPLNPRRPAAAAAAARSVETGETPLPNKPTAGDYIQDIMELRATRFMDVDDYNPEWV